MTRTLERDRQQASLFSCIKLSKMVLVYSTNGLRGPRRSAQRELAKIAFVGNLVASEYMGGVENVRYIFPSGSWVRDLVRRGKFLASSGDDVDGSVAHANIPELPSKAPQLLP